jgi:hypothetical protein
MQAGNIHDLAAELGLACISAYKVRLIVAFASIDCYWARASYLIRSVEFLDAATLRLPIPRCVLSMYQMDARKALLVPSEDDESLTKAQKNQQLSGTYGALTADREFSK